MTCLRAGRTPSTSSSPVLPSARRPGHPRGAAVIRQEGDQFVVLLCGILGEDPPTDDEGMLAFAESLPASDVADVLRLARARSRHPVFSGASVAART